jgi:serine/threonine protein kinase
MTVRVNPEGSSQAPGGRAVSACPDRETLVSLLSSNSTVNGELAGHLENCAECQRTLDQLSDSGLLRDYRPIAIKRAHALPAFGPPVRPGDLGTLGDLAIEKVIGRGGMGIVFQGRDLRLEREVAVKFLLPGSSPESERRFVREARAVAALKHDNVVPVYHIGQNEAGQDYIVLPLIAGQTLRERLQTSELSPGDSSEIIRQMTDALANAHSCGLIHRDIKPANILLDRSPQRAKITDFGLARVVEDSTLTQADMLCGTPEYMSPEQAALGDRIDSRSDIYSLGVTFYECLTGTPPFRGRPLEVIDQHRDATPIPPGKLNRAVPRDLETICLKAMSKEVEGRYQTMEAFGDDLKRWQQGKPVLARRPGTWQRLSKWFRREPRFAVALAAVATTLVAGVAVSWFYWSRSVEMSALAAARFDASLQTINTLADLTSQSLSGDPGLASIRKQVQTLADKAFEPLVAMRPTDASNLVRYLKAMDNLGTIRHSVAGPAETLAFRQKIIAGNRVIVGDFPDHGPLQREWANLHHRLAVCHIEMGDFPKASEALDEASRLLDENAIEDRLLIARVMHSRGTIHKWVNNDNAAAAADFREAVEMAGLYTAAFPDDPIAQATMNNSRGWLADCELQLGNADLAEELLREVYASYSALADSPDATYSHRLDKGRAAFTLMNVLVTRGEGAEAILWSLMVEPEIRLLQDSNPTLMEPAALKIGFDCHITSAELLQGNFDEAMKRMELALADAIALDSRFPNTTRTWQVLGHARQMWCIASSHAGNYERLVPFLEDWISQVETDIAQQKNAGFNQQLRTSLLFELAKALEETDDRRLATGTWQQVLSSADAMQKPGFQLLSQVFDFREARRIREPFAIVLDAGLQQSIDSLQSIAQQGIPYPATQHSLAECYALAALLSESDQDSEEGTNPDPQQAELYRGQALNCLKRAQAGGFYQLPRRREQALSNPLFEGEDFRNTISPDETRLP